MPFKINHFPSKQKPDPVRDVYPPLSYDPARVYLNTSRYKNVRTLRVKHNAHPNKFMPKPFERSRSKQLHETVYNKFITNSVEDRFHTVDNITTNRLDIIAQIYYGSPTLWWVIAQANPQVAFDPFSVPRGTKLRIPVFNSLYNDRSVLDVR